MTGQRELIVRFLRLERIAVVGVSRDRADFTRKLWSAFRARGIDAVPVHPSQRDIEGIQCFSRVQDIVPAVEGALITVPKGNMVHAIRDCVVADIDLVWLYGIRGSKDIEPDAIELCRIHDIDAVFGYCPFMFLPETPFFHRVHAFGSRLLGSYPK